MPRRKRNNTPGKPGRKVVTKDNKQKKFIKNKNPYNKKKAPSGFIGDKNVGSISGAGVRSNVMVITACNVVAVEAAWCSLITKVWTRGYNENLATLGPAYWAYVAAVRDLVNVMTNQTTSVYSRLEYLNSVIAALAPKTIPYKVGTLDYGWTNGGSVLSPNKIVIRGYSYYFYVLSSLSNGAGWFIQNPPPVPPDDASALASLVKVYDLLANSDNAWTKYRSSIDLDKGDFGKDASAFVQVSPYYGNGNSVDSSGAAVSQDLEVPYKSLLVGVFCPYSIANGRVGNVFRRGSTDSTFLFGVPLNPEFEYINLFTCYAPCLCFIDVDEIVTICMHWMYSLIQQGIAGMTDVIIANQPEVLASLEAFTFTAQTFRLFIGQCLKAYFADEVSCTQFMRYSDAAGSFEPLRCGSNNYPPIFNNGNIILPSPLVENLRMLKAKGYRIPTKFENDKNKIFYYPVLGVYRNSVTPTISTGTFFDGEAAGTVTSPMFAPPDVLDPNIIDGTDGVGNCIDINSSPQINNLLAEWNSRVGVLSQYSVDTCQLAGASRGSLLALTRFCRYRQLEIPLEKVPRFFVKNLQKEFINKVPLTSRKSQKEISGFKEIYVPPNSSLASQFTNSYSSVYTITEQVKSFLSYFIVPSIVLEDGNVPTQQEVRIANYQGQVIVLPTQEDQFVSRQFELIVIAKKYAPGIAAGKNDEMVAVLDYMNKQNMGGFLGQALGGLVDSLIPGLGGAGKAIGGILPF